MTAGAHAAAPPRGQQAAVVSVDAVRVYLHRIGRTKLLTAAEEVELAISIEVGVFATERLRRSDAGDEPLASGLHRDLRQLARDGARAQTNLIEANLRLVVSVAKRYAGHGLPFLDLVQEGNLGLIRAVEKFDYGKGYKFSTYATWWIRQAVGRAVSDQSRMIRLPAHVGDLVTRISRAQRELLVELGRDPTPAELAKVAGLTAERVLELRRLGRDPVSLDQPVGDTDDTRLGDLVEDTGGITADDVAISAAMHHQIESVLNGLTDREAGIIRLRFGLGGGRPRTLEEISRVYGVTRERIRQIENTTMVKLRHPARARRLRDYLD